MLELYNDNDMKKVLDVFSDAVNKMAEIMRNIISNIGEIRERIERVEKCCNSWHVPKKIVMNHQVLNRKPLVPHMRER